MGFELVKEMSGIEPFLIKNSVVKPYIFKRTNVGDSRIFYTVVFQYENNVHLTEDSVPQESFLQGFLERILSEVIISNINILQISKHDYYKKMADLSVTQKLGLQPFTIFSAQKFKKKKSFIYKILQSIEILLQIITKERHKEIEKQRLYVAHGAQVGNWNLSFKIIELPFKDETLQFIIDEINSIA